MMLLLMILLGGFVGWLLSQVSIVLPRFSHNLSAEEKLSFSWNTPALLYVPRALKPRWFGLHLALELATAGIFGLTWIHFGASWELMGALFSFAFLMLVAVIDIKHRLVLNVMIYPAIFVVLIANLFLLKQDARSILLGGSMIFAIFYMTAQLKSGELGGGDVKLATLFGFAFGFPNVLWALLVGAGAGAFVAVYLIFGKQNSRNITIPYAPFLCLGAAIAMLYNPFSALL